MEQFQNLPKNSTSSSSKGAHKNGFVDQAKDLLTMNEDHQEGQATKAIENQTSKIPSGFYLAMALGSMALSATLAATSRRKEMANFVGLWAPSFLMLGLYNKIVKTHGSDSQTPA